MKSKTSPVRFHVLQPLVLPQKTRLKSFLRELMKKEHKTLGALDYIFCSDEYLLNINQVFLQHDELTDIITFDLSEDKSLITGEVYISVERVKDNALLFHVPFLLELYRVIFHGALHLCGYKDKNRVDQAKMRKKEDQYLMLYK